MSLGVKCMLRPKMRLMPGAWEAPLKGLSRSSFVVMTVPELRLMVVIAETWTAMRSESSKKRRETGELGEKGEPVASSPAHEGL